MTGNVPESSGGLHARSTAPRVVPGAAVRPCGAWATVEPVVEALADATPEDPVPTSTATTRYAHSTPAPQASVVMNAPAGIT